MTHINVTSALHVLSFSPLSEETCQVVGISSFVEDEVVSLVIPEIAPDGRKVTAIGDRAFSGMTSLQRVDVPASVETIGVRAFAFCSNLMEIRFGKRNGCDSSLSHIGDRAFMGCERLTVLALGELCGDLTCGKKVFAHCTRLRAAVLPVGMDTVYESMFEGCRALTYVRLPEELKTIRSSAFSSCLSLTALSLPHKVSFIDDCAFAFCSSLGNVVLPEDECVVSASAFLNCPARPDFMQAG